VNDRSLPSFDALHNPLSDITLEQLPANLQQGAARAGWTSLVAVQARAIPYLLAGRNMMIQARTGQKHAVTRVEPIFDSEQEIRGYMAFTTP